MKKIKRISSNNRGVVDWTLRRRGYADSTDSEIAAAERWISSHSSHKTTPVSEIAAFVMGMRVGPRADDKVAAWLKERRDSLRQARDISGAPPRVTYGYDLLARSIDDLIDEYRMHAATGTQLDEDTGEP